MKKKAPTMLHVGATQDHQAGYVRRAFRSLEVVDLADMYINLTTAEALGLEVPPTLLTRADRDRPLLGTYPAVCFAFDGGDKVRGEKSTKTRSFGARCRLDGHRIRRCANVIDDRDDRDGNACCNQTILDRGGTTFICNETLNGRWHQHGAASRSGHCVSAVTVFMVRSWLHDAALELRRRGANMNHVLSLITFAIGALCFVVFITALRPPLHQSEVAVGSIYGRGDVT